MSEKKTRVSAVIVAAGKGKRFSGGIKKQFYPVKGKPIIVWTINAFVKNKRVDDIIIVLEKEDKGYFSKEILGRFQFSKDIRLVDGGPMRQDSAYNGITSVTEDTDIILIHDGARPFVKGEIIEKVIDESIKEGAAVAAVKQNDTTIYSEGGYIKNFINREFVYGVQTPQAFRRELIMKGFQKAYEDKFYGTDDSSLVVRMGKKVKIVEGSIDNIKITSRDDIYIAEKILENFGE